MPANTNILALLGQNTFVRIKGSRSSIFCLEHTLLLLQPFISCKCLETSVLPDAVIVSPRIAIYGLVTYPLQVVT